jgi:uncharacterized protein YbjT (DUF2867 family)
MKTILVTGIRGKTGRQVAKELVQREGVAVRGAARTPADVKLSGVTVARFDWGDSSTWSPALAGVEAIYLVKPKTSDPAATVASFLQMANDLERVVLLSEIDAGGRDESTDERKVERVIESCRLAWTVLRPNWFMQNYTEPSFYLEDIRDAGKLDVPTGGQRTSFVDTRDIADVAVAALLESRHAGRHYTITGPQALTLAEVAGSIGHAAGYHLRYMDPALGEYLQELARKGTPNDSIEYYRRVYTSIQEGATSVISPDVEQVTGHPPRSFSAFVEEHSNAWRRPRHKPN